MRETLLLLVGLAVWASPAAGQTPLPGPVASVFFRSAARGPLSVAWSSEPHDSVVRDIRPTYWKEGALVGALLGAVGGAVVGGGFCRMSDEFGKDCTASTVLGGVGGAVLLVIPGALIGGQFRKGGGGGGSSPD
jgi:hypothetical protein